MPQNHMSPNSVIEQLAKDCNAWPFIEARKIISRYGANMPQQVVFETGYGPSGLPHIGTFGEVARTTMVRYAFSVLTGHKVATKLLCFSDDMDALRKVPDNVPAREEMARYLQHPLTKVPDPFGENFSSFAAGNNARLCQFLDQFGFDYEFASATDYYHSGRFDDMLLKMLEHYDEVMAVMLPSLGQERQATYSPFLPISPFSGKVLQVPIIERNLSRGTISYIEPESGEKIETEVTKGKVKCQWKADWALRWAALGVDYEMSGKDLIASVNLASKICRILGAKPPEGFNYELFLDAQGQKISKSKGNGLTIEEWLRYAPPESLALYMYQKPKTAKRLYFDIIPKLVDEYLALTKSYADAPIEEQIKSPLWHIFSAKVPYFAIPISFTMLLNLASAANASDRELLWGYIERYIGKLSDQAHEFMDKLVTYVLRYYEDFVAPFKQFKIASPYERDVLQFLSQELEQLKTQEAARDGQFLQNHLLSIARHFDLYLDKSKTNNKGEYAVSPQFFQMLYETLLGQKSGPRFGSFIAIYGIAETQALIEQALSRHAQ